MQLVCLLLFIFQGSASPDASADADIEDQCGCAEAKVFSVELLQRSVTILPGVRKATEIDNVPSPQFNARDLHMSEQQLHGELQSAKQARNAVLSSLQQWDERVTALEDQLSASRNMGHGAAVFDVPVLGKMGNASPIILPTETDPKLDSSNLLKGRVIVLCALVVLIALHMIWTIHKHEVERDDMDPPWFHESKCMAKVLSAVGLLWLTTGIFCFTTLLTFTDTDFDRSDRHLTVIESIYLSAQIVTTVGYGDLCPATDLGRVLMAFYVLSGVVVIGAMLQQFVLMFMEPSETQTCGTQVPFLGKYQEIIQSILLVITCMGFGTLFFSLYPGEGKTIFEAFYMSVITLLTVGFGAYHPVTQIGKLVAALWMIIGVACVGGAVASVTGTLFQQRQSNRTRASAMKLFKEIDEDNSGTIDRVEFLTFEMVRGGIEKHVADTAMAKFDEFDTDGSGTLDFEEFEKYVAAI